MEITEVRVRLVSAQNEKLRAFCSITIDHDFVVRDLRIIEGPKGPFVAMPSRRLTQKCSRCGAKNPYGANYCNDCGKRLPPPRELDSRRAKLHSDIAHPINSKCREVIQKQVLEEYAAELERAKAPGYRPAEADEFEGEYPEASVQEDAALETPAPDAASENDAAGEEAPPEESPPQERGPVPQRGGERRFGKSRRRRHFRTDGRGGGADGDRGEGRRRRHGECRRWNESGGGRAPLPPARDRGGLGAPRPEARPSEESAPKIPEPEEDYFASDRLRKESAAETRRLPIEPDVEPEDNFGAGIFS